jgi:hypothetical protein
MVSTIIFYKQGSIFWEKEVIKNIGVNTEQHDSEDYEENIKDKRASFQHTF